MLAGYRTVNKSLSVVVSLVLCIEEVAWCIEGDSMEFIFLFSKCALRQTVSTCSRNICSDIFDNMGI